MSFIASAFGLAAPQAALAAKAVEVVAVVAIATGAIGWWNHHERGIELAKLQKSSDQVKADAAQQVTDNNLHHQATDKANQETLDEAHRQAAAAAAQRDTVAAAFAEWVHEHPDSGANGAVARAAGQPGPEGRGECGPLSCADLAIKLLQDGDGLARSLTVVDADLQSCQRDRDSLTGLPR